MATIATLNVVLRAQSKAFNKSLGSASKRLSKFSKSIQGIGTMAGRGFLAIAGAAGVAIREAANFEKQLASVQTMLSETNEQFMGPFRSGLLELSEQFGQSTKTLSKGLYDLLSASIAPGKALAVLETASKAAVGGMTDTAIAVDGLTSLMNAYGVSSEEVAIISDRMFTTVKRGKITFEQLASNIGKIAPMAKAANVPMETMLAGIATLTRQGLSAEEATTRLNAVFKAMPGSVRNLIAVVSEFKGMNLEQIMKIVPEQLAASGLAAMAADITGLSGDIGLMGNAAGATQEAFDKMAGTFTFSLAQLQMGFRRVLVMIGDKLLPVAERWLDQVKRLRDTIKKLSDKEIQALVDKGIMLAKVLGGIWMGAKVIAGINGLIKLMLTLKGAVIALGGSLGTLAMGPIAILAVGFGLIAMKAKKAIDRMREIESMSQTFATLQRGVAAAREDVGLAGNVQQRHEAMERIASLRRRQAELTRTEAGGIEDSGARAARFDMATRFDDFARATERQIRFEEDQAARQLAEQKKTNQLLTEFATQQGLR